MQNARLDKEERQWLYTHITVSKRWHSVKPHGEICAQNSPLGREPKERDYNTVIEHLSPVSTTRVDGPS